MMSDVACEPELPPELMMSGMKRLSTSPRLNSTWKCCMAVAVSISLKNSAQSQPARFRIIVERAMLG